MTPAIIIQLILSLLDRAAAIGDLFCRAKSEGRDVTFEEVKAAREFYRASLADLDAEIAKAEKP